MDKNIIDVLQLKNLIEWYSNQRDMIFMSIILALLFIYIALHEATWEEERTAEEKQIFRKNVLNTGIVILIGICFNVAGVELNFVTEYMPFLLFVSVTMIVVSVQIFECLKFRKNFWRVIEQTNKILCKMIMAEVLLLIIMGRLEIVEFICAVFGIMTLTETNRYIEKVVCVKYEQEGEQEYIDLKNDLPVLNEEELFDSRKKQIDNFCKELKNIGNNPFAVAISGEWGSGKTSFVNVLKKKLDRAEFVDVECSLEYDTKGILNDIAVQMQKIFVKNQIYTGRNSTIEKYFQKIGEIAEQAGYSGMTKFFDKLSLKENNSYLENKEKLNMELKKFYAMTQKRIYIVIDNMDRIIEDEKRAVLFQVVRESVGLNHCVTLFLVDYDKLCSDYLSKEFLEKYVNYRVELTPIQFDEIVAKYENYFLTETFWNDRSTCIADKGRDVKATLVEWFSEKFSKIQEEISICEQADQKHNCELLKNMEMRLRGRTKNPRKVKRFLDSIEKMLFIADIVWFKDKKADENEYSQVNWVKVIVQVAFLKIFLTEEYDAMVAAGNIRTFEKNPDDSFCVEYILDGFQLFRVGASDMKDVIAFVVYRLYALDIQTDITEHQKLLDEIKKKKYKEENLGLYINECLGYNYNYGRMWEILTYIEKHTFENIRYKCAAMVNIMSVISSEIFSWRDGYLEIAKKINQINWKLKKGGIFNNAEWGEIQSYLKNLEMRLIYGNISIIRSMLNILFEGKVGEGWGDVLVGSSYDYGIHSLYMAILKISETDQMLEKREASQTELSVLKNYFQCIETEFACAKEYEYARNELQYFLSRITKTIEVLEVWFGNEDEDQVEQEDVNIYNVIERATQSAEQLSESLAILKKYLSENRGEISMAEAFIGMVEMLEKKFRKSSDWLGENKQEMIGLLCEIYDKIQQNYPEVNKKYDDRWRFCRIRLFRLRRNQSE